jgi:hypothetical protein
MGLSTALYRRSLVSLDSVDHLRFIRLSCFLLVFLSFGHVSLLSRCMPRYFSSFFWGRATLPICAAGQVSLRRVNVICMDLP